MPLEDTNTNTDAFDEWDRIYNQIDEAKKNNPNLVKSIKKSKTFTDEDGDTRCSKCGSTDDIDSCFECLQQKNI